MKTAISFLVLLLTLPTFGQSPNGTASDLQALLTQLDQTAQGAALQIASLRIEKWKMDSDYKRQAQANAESLQRNLTYALPALISSSRGAPGSLTPNFKLYRNVNALSEVLTSLTESAGAFGKKEEYEALAQYAATFDQARRSLAEYFEQLAAQKDLELGRLRNVSASETTTRPKKVIVDNEPEKKPRSKRKN